MEIYSLVVMIYIKFINEQFSINVLSTRLLNRQYSNVCKPIISTLNFLSNEHNMWMEPSNPFRQLIADAPSNPIPTSDDL